MAQKFLTDVNLAGNTIYNAIIDSSCTLQTSQQLRHLENIGDGVNTTFTIEHDIGTQDVAVQIRQTTSPFRAIYPSNYIDMPEVQFSDINHVTCIFYTPPSMGQYRIMVTGEPDAVITDIDGGNASMIVTRTINGGNASTRKWELRIDGGTTSEPIKVIDGGSASNARSRTINGGNASEVIQIYSINGGNANG